MGKAEEHNGHENLNNHSDGHSDSHSGESHKEQTVMDQVMGELTDHREFTVFNHRLFELPVILYDEDGLKTYSGIHVMEADGEYVYSHHKIVKASDHHTPPTLDLSITNFVAFQFLAAMIVIFLFAKARSAYKKNPDGAPSGLQNLVEIFILFIRDEVVRPNIPVRKIADSLTPYFITIFFFIYVMNMVGLLPGGHTPTSSLSITAGLALTAFVVIIAYQIKQEGFGGFFKHLMAGAPFPVSLLMIVIEAAGLIIKPAVLAIRLFANMSAGHTVLFSFIGLILLNGATGTPFSLMALFVYLLELLVAFLQAYIFTMLTAIFLGLGLHDENDHSHAH
jgi:F-type H+-transporting ATPase subunit a